MKSENRPESAPKSMTIPATPGARLKLLMNENQKTSLDVAALISDKLDKRGYPSSRSTVSNWTQDKLRITELALRKLEETWLWNRAFIRDGKLPKYVKAARPVFTPVPRLTLRDQQLGDAAYLAAPLGWKTRHSLMGEQSHEMIVVEMADEAMSPLILPGAIVLARLLDKLHWTEASRVVIACWHDQVVIRRVETLDDEWIYLRPDNPKGIGYRKRLSEITWLAQAEKILESAIQ